MSEIEKYSKNKLAKEISIIQSSNRNSEILELNVYEKSIIFKYSVDGYEVVNENLRKTKGKKNTEFGKLLTKVLDKLPDFDGLVYRSANLTKSEIKKYESAYINNELLQEFSFVSTSKSRLIAMAFNGNVLFRLYSRTGKEIEKIAKFGTHGFPNEKEVLFIANRKFKILEMADETNYKLITMEEI